MPGPNLERQRGIFRLVSKDCSSKTMTCPSKGSA